MIKRILIIFCSFIFLGLLQAENIIDLNFYNELKSDFYDFKEFREFQQSSRSDSIDCYDIFSGRILSRYEGDIFPLAFLNYVNCDIASPTDYLFTIDTSQLDFDLLASNISSDSLRILPFKILKSDSLKVGVFSLYTPDFFVKNEIGSKAKLNYDIFAIARAQTEFLRARTDVVVMISNLSKYIDSDIVNGLPVDVVLSSDYLQKSDGFLNDRTRFYSIVSNKGEFGKLRLRYSAGTVEYNWSEIKIILDREKTETPEAKKDAAGDR